MGHQPKLLLPLADGRPLLWHTASNALILGPKEVILVTRPDLPELAVAVSDLKVRCISNYRYAEGLGTSLAAGIGVLHDDAEAALVMLGDEPYVNPLIIEAIMAAYEKERKPITMPLYGDRPGPPTLFAREIFSELLKLEGDTGGRQLAQKHPDRVCFVPFDEAIRPKDIDTQEDYQAIL
jgi:molybdenum cofactor cytidylyltransferase